VANDDGWKVGRDMPVKLIRTGRNLGYAGGMNVGLRWATDQGFEYVALITNDGWFRDTNSIVTLADHIRMDQGIAAIGPNLFRRTGEELRPWFPQTDIYPRQAPKAAVPVQNGPHGRMIGVGWLGGSCLFVRTAAVDDIGFFDESLFMYAEEVDWCYRALIRGWGLSRDESVSFFEEASASSSRVPGLKEYYMTRNRLVTARRYQGPRQVAQLTISSLRQAIGLARRRDYHWRWVARGIVDSMVGRMGRREDLHPERSIESPIRSLDLSDAE
jgi:GT2 family glycosyltransferase